jgi:tetratricopeptide (TPR) repeat protein
MELSNDAPRIAALHGRILIARGQLSEAETVFRVILERQPNNVSARTGLAELALAEAGVELARANLEQALQFAPRDRRVLLSLAVIAQESGDRAALDRYLESALRFHGASASVQVFAAEVRLAAGDLADAEERARTALAVEPANSRALNVLARSLFRRGSYLEALAVIDQVLTSAPESTDAWYLRGVAQARTNNLDDAIQSFQRGLLLNRQDEILRLAAEEELLAGTQLEDPRREEFADYHFERASDFESQNLFDRARFHYRRGLRLNPFDRDGRFAYAELFRLDGFEGKFLEELEVLAELGFSDTEISDLIEVYSGRREDGVAARWGVDQFAVEQDRLSLAVFLETANTGRPEAGEYLRLFIEDLLLESERIQVNEAGSVMQDFGRTFAAARNGGSRYFLIAEAEQSNRSLSLEAELYLSRTGTPLRSYGVVRSGNDRVAQASRELTRLISADIPLFGSIVAREPGEALVNLGRLSGLGEDETLLILRPGSLSLSAEAPLVLYQDEAVLGSMRITERDDLVSVGELSPADILDLIDAGDRVIRERSEQEAESESRPVELPGFPDVYERVRSIR